MQLLHQAADRLEAQLLGDLLSASGIANRIFGDYLSGAVGALPADLAPTLWVMDARDVGRARLLLAGWLAERQAWASTGSWVCRGCGELLEGSFGLCWRCGGERPAGPSD